MGTLAHAAGVVVLDDDAGRGLELPDQAGAGIGVEQVVEAELLALVLEAGGHALDLAPGLHIEGRGLVGVLAVAQPLLLDQVQGEVVGQLRGLAGLQLPLHPAGDGGIVGGGPAEGLQGAAAAVLQVPGARLELLQEGAVLVRIGQHCHRGVVLGGAADHAGAADVDLLDGLGRRDALPGDGGLEGIEVDDHQVDGLDALGLGVGHMIGQVAAKQQAAVDAGMQRLHSAVKALGSAGVARHLDGFQPGFLEGPQGAARGQDPPALGQQALGQGEKPRLVVDRDQCRWHGCPLNPLFFHAFSPSG